MRSGLAEIQNLAEKYDTDINLYQKNMTMAKQRLKESRPRIETEGSKLNHAMRNYDTEMARRTVLESDPDPFEHKGKGLVPATALEGGLGGGLSRSLSSGAGLMSPQRIRQMRIAQDNQRKQAAKMREAIQQAKKSGKGDNTSPISNTRKSMEILTHMDGWDSKKVAEDSNSPRPMENSDSGFFEENPMHTAVTGANAQHSNPSTADADDPEEVSSVVSNNSFDYSLFDASSVITDIEETKEGNPMRRKGDNENLPRPHTMGNTEDKKFERSHSLFSRTSSSASGKDLQMESVGSTQSMMMRLPIRARTSKKRTRIVPVTMNNLVEKEK
jgi:hypothetical protein